MFDLEAEPLPAQCFPPAVIGDPLVDGDGDGTINRDDNCPTIANADQHDEDGDCNGDACDNCPHDAIDPATIENLDGDGAGDVCDIESQLDNNVRFEPFVVEPAVGEWFRNPSACVWETADDRYVQKTPGPALVCFTANIAPAQVTNGLAKTRIQIPEETLDSGRPFAAGLLYRVFACGNGCNGPRILIARDAEGDWLRAEDGSEGNHTLVTQRRLRGRLDGTPIGLAIRYVNSGNATATINYRGLEDTLDITQTLPIQGGNPGFVTEGTSAAFHDLFAVE